MEEKIKITEEFETESWQTRKFNIDSNYEYIKKGKIFNILSNLIYYGIAYPILKIVTKLIYDFKIEGRENLKNVQEGAISISNHVLVLDCAMIGIAFGKKKIYYTTQEESFMIPFVRKLIKFLRAIPIPKKIENKKNFIKEINSAIKQGKTIHFYPEATLKPYCTKIRNFKSGAFNLAIKNNTSIVPMVFIFRNPEGIRKIFKTKKDVTLKILKPIKCDTTYKIEEVEQLKKYVKNEMEKAINDEIKPEDEKIFAKC